MTLGERINLLVNLLEQLQANGQTSSGDVVTYSYRDEVNVLKSRRTREVHFLLIPLV